MENVMQANSEAKLNELRKCINECSEANVVTSINRVVEVDGEIKMQEINSNLTKTVTKNRINVEDNYVYVDVKYDLKRTKELLKTESLWDIFLSRGTEMFLQNKGNDYFFRLEIIKLDVNSNRSYNILFYNPKFFSIQNENTIRYAIPIENMQFGIEYIDYAEMLFDIDYEEGVNPTITDDEEENDFINNDNFLGTNYDEL